MGKVVNDNAGSDNSGCERKRTVRDERKIRTKKKKRKKDLTDLHQRLCKAKKNKETKINGKREKARSSKRICNRILPQPLTGIYKNGAVGKEIKRSQMNLPMNDTHNARLQGNVLKLLQGYNSKSQGIIIGNNSEDGRKESLLDSAIKDILNPTPPGIECSSPVLGKVDGKKRCQKNFMEAVGPSKYHQFLQKSPEKRNPQNSKCLRDSAITRYEELCATISSENFEGYNTLDQLTADPLIAVKKKLRKFYADSFRNQFLRDMIKRGTSEYESARYSSANDVPSEVPYFPDSQEDSQIVSLTTQDANCQMRNKNEREAGFNPNVKRNHLPASNLLFSLSLLNGSNNYTNEENIVESERMEKVIDIESDDGLMDLNKRTYAFHDVNYSNTSTCRDDNPINYLEDSIAACLNRAENAGEQTRNKPVHLFPNETGIVNAVAAKKRLIKRKNQHTQTMHSLITTAMKKHSGKHGSKASQQIKMKNLKHIPAILRRRNNAVAKNNLVNIFVDSTGADEESQKTLLSLKSKEDVLFTPRSLLTKLNRNEKRLETTAAVNAILNDVGTEDIDVQTCVIASPSIHNNEVRFVKNSRSQVESKQLLHNANVNNIFPRNNKKSAYAFKQKTIMFTKKDSHNISQCLHTKNLISDGTDKNSNICVMRKSLPQPQEKSARNIGVAHRNYQELSMNCYRSHHCLQNSDSNHSSQEFKDPNLSHLETAQVQKEPIAYEKVFLRRVQQDPRYQNNCRKNEKVCYVVVDQCENSDSSKNCTVDKRPSQIENSRILQNKRCCHEDIGDVGILQGVQNLQILPMEECKSQAGFTNSQCIRNTVLLEKQPTKYLAVENDSKVERIPMYVQNNRVASVDNMELINPKVNYHVASYPEEPDQKIILVPAREQKNVVYIQQPNLNHSNVPCERHSHPKKVVFCRQERQSNAQYVNDSSDLCEIHVPKKNLRGIRSANFEGVAINLQKPDDKPLNRDHWEELHYRSSHEHPLANDVYTRNQTVFYET